MIDQKLIDKIKEEGWDYKCCDGSPKCANNKTKKFIDYLQKLAQTDTSEFRNTLWNYIEGVETERDVYRIKAKELFSHFTKPAKE